MNYLIFLFTTFFLCFSCLNAQSILENMQAKPISPEILKKNYISIVDLHINAEGTFFLFYKVDPAIQEWVDLPLPTHVKEFSKFFRKYFTSIRKGLILVQNDTLFLESCDQLSLIPISFDKISEYEPIADNWGGHYQHVDLLHFNSSKEIKVRTTPNEKFEVLPYSTFVVEELRNEGDLLEVWVNQSINGIFHDFSVENDTLKLYSGTEHYWVYAIDKTEDVARITKSKDGYFLEFDNLGFPVKMPVEFEPMGE